MSTNPLLQAYLASTRSRQPNMAMTEVDNLFNPYTYTGMSDANRVASLGDPALVNQNVPMGRDPRASEPDFGASQFVDEFVGTSIKEPTVNKAPTQTQTQMSPYDQFQRNIKENVFNPRTNEFEPTTYLLDRIAPNYSQRITNFMTGARPDMSQSQLDAIQANVRNFQAETLSNPVRSAMQMQASLPDPMAGQRSGAEQEEFDRRQADAQRRADDFDAFIQRERTRNLEDSLGLDRGSRGGQPTAFESGGFFSSLFGGGNDDGDSNSIFNF